MLVPPVAILILTTLGSRVQGVEPVDAILSGFDSAWVVAVGENHGHQEFHDLILSVLEDPRSSPIIDDIAVEWGNALYQPVMDRYLIGDSVPWDSVTMAWRNTVVSPNTVWDAPVYESFFRSVRRINEALAGPRKYRVLLADSPVDWSTVGAIEDLRPYFDRALSMATTIRTESLRKGRRTLLLAGGLHVARRPRVRANEAGVPVGEVTPVAWLELHHPGSTYVIQSMGAGRALGLDVLVGAGPARVLRLRDAPEARVIPANATTTLRNRDGSRSDVYGTATLGEIVDAIIVWGDDWLSFTDPDPSAYLVDWYWAELNRRSTMLRGHPMDASLRQPGGA
jgi:hypothetical protein